MMRILSAQEIKAVECAADQNGISFLRLMENAGAACAKAIRRRFDSTDKRQVAVLCGKGKNGGDGFVAARKLWENGYTVRVYLTAGPPVAPDAAEMYRRIADSNICIEVYDPAAEAQRRRIQSADIVVDAVFGTGFSGALPEDLQALFRALEENSGYTVSIDLPSGVCADTGKLECRPFCADLTITVMALKKALVTPPAKDFAGEIEVVSIGVPESLYRPYEKVFAFTDEDVAAILPKRASDAHKGDCGIGLLIGGSYTMPGAALLASGGCIESGVGLLKLAFPETAYPAMTASVPEKILLPLPANRNGYFSAQGEAGLLAALTSCSACLLGCGMGLDADTIRLTKAVLRTAKCPLILDADGINAVADDIDIVREAAAPVVLTPHPGEAARLLGCTATDIQADRLGACAALCEKTGATVVLKGAGTIISADGKRFSVNLTGNAGMATAGSGDLLAGILLGLLCQGCSPLEAAVAAVHIHGKAGDAVAQTGAVCSTTPTKMLAALPQVLSQFE